jgi:hypothetical protein
MSYSTKGMLALLRDLMAHDPRLRARPSVDRTAIGTVPLPPSDHGWTTTSSFDLATASGDAHWSTATGSPLLGERLPALRAELDRRQGLVHRG